MVTANTPSPYPAPDNDANAFSNLREMYKRYMLNPAVAQWLLSRDAPTDFQAVRRENSVMVSISPASPPKVIPHTTPHTPFPTSSDLMFLDHVRHGFAFGHIWGNLQPDTHPFASLAARASISGWGHVQSRKFASHLAADGVLEIVEYTWFTDNRSLVVLSRVPCKPANRAVRVSEILFFGPIHRTDIPPQRPELVLLVHDRSLCAACGRELCSCPSAIGIERATRHSCPLTQDSPNPHRKSMPNETMAQSWEDRARVVYHGNKRGLLSIVYSGSSTPNFSQITVRQAYVSVCEHQDAIGYRIQQHLTKLFARVPPVSSNSMPQPPSAINGIPTFTPTQHCGNPLSLEVSSQSPISFTRREGGWFESPRQMIFPPPQDKLMSGCGDHKQGCCSNATQTPKLTNTCGHEQATSCSEKVEIGATTECPMSCKPSKGDLSSVQGAPVGATGQPSIIPKRTNRQTLKGEEQDTAFQNSLCGPGKAGKECDCSAEKMQDPALARILNSQRDHSVPDTMDDMTSFIEPIFTCSPSGGNSVLQAVPSMSPNALISNISKSQQRRAEQSCGAVPPFDSQSPDSTRCGTSTTGPSPLPPPPVLHVEPALKRPRTDSYVKPDQVGFGLEAAWQSSSEDRDKILPLPAWNGAGGHIERPLSALSRALGVARSPSPFALMSTLPKTPSPPAPPIGAHGFSFGKPAAGDFDFQSPFDSLPIPSLAEFAKKSEGLEQRAQAGCLPGIREKSPVNGSWPSTGAAAIDTATGRGVCCDICGISFAKRSNKLRHIQTVHNRLKQFECDLCGAKFGLKADLGRHRFRIHESRAFRCDTCGKSFAEQGQLEHHVRVTHEEDSRPWECKTCRIRFGRKSSLTRHERTVHLQTRFVCRLCKKSYSQKFDAVRHERRVHGVHDSAGSAGIKHLTS